MSNTRSSKHSLAVLCCGIVAGCSGPESAPEDPALSALSVPVPALDQYVVLASRGASFGDRNQISGGDVGVAPTTGLLPNTLFGGSDARVGIGEVLLSPRLVLFPRAVAGEVGANRVETLFASTGPVSAYAAPPALPLPTAATPGTSLVFVASGQTRALAAGRYGAVTVSGTLNLSGGTYEMQSLLLTPDARVVALARSNLRIADNLLAADRARVQAAAPLRAGDLRLSVSGPLLTFGTDARLNALVMARGLFFGADRFAGTGAIAAQDVLIGNDSRMAFDTGFECSSAAGCDDGNPCTTDACSDAECTHTAVGDGTACSDGDACTRSDVCQAGVCTGADPVVCDPPDQCHDPGSCDPATGVCSNPDKPNGEPCDDGDACSHGDSCEAGTCTPGTDLAVTEFDTGLAQPASIITGPLGSLWFVSPETAPDSLTGAIARIAPSGTVTQSGVLGRFPDAVIEGPDGLLWVSQRLVGGLPALSRFDPASGAFVSDFVGILAVDLAATNEGGAPIVWFTGGNSVERITPDGTRLPGVPTRNATRAIAVASSTLPNAIWVTEANTGSGVALIGRIDVPNLIQFPIDSPGELSDLTEGPDKNIWFTDAGNNHIGRLAPTGADLAAFAIPTPASDPRAITVGADDNLWFTQRAANKIGRITSSGQITDVCIPTPGSQPTSITAGPDGNIWFTEAGAGKVGRVSLSP